MNKDLVTTGPQHRSTNTVSAFLAVTTHTVKKEKGNSYSQKGHVYKEGSKRDVGAVSGSLITAHTQEPGKDPGLTLKTQSCLTSPDLLKILLPQYCTGAKLPSAPPHWG